MKKERTKVLWVCNVPIPQIAENMGIKPPNICGWITGFANSLLQDNSVELHVCFPLLGLKEMVSGKVENISYYAFSQPKMFGILPAEDQLIITDKMKRQINEIIQVVKPDILHCFGTEYQHTLVAIESFNNSKKTIINIQGLTSVCWRHYNTGIPFNETRRFAVSNLIRGNLIHQAKRMEKRGQIEINSIKKAGNIIGRTDWDHECTSQINPTAIYYHCNESLRDSFYYGKWQYEDCIKHSIFMSQAAYPIKGLHFMLQALPEIIDAFPDAHLYVAGNDLTKADSLYSKLKSTSYAGYIRKLISKERLENKVTFLGPLSESQMKSQYLKSNVFVSSSTIENSPNSLGEAMLLGVPCVSSYVGGVTSLLKHDSEGYLYQCDAPYMLAYYVKKIFTSPDLAMQLGVRAKAHASKTHDRKNNIESLLNIYKDVVENN